MRDLYSLTKFPISGVSSLWFDGVVNRKIIRNYERGRVSSLWFDGVVNHKIFIDVSPDRLNSLWFDRVINLGIMYGVLVSDKISSEFDMKSPLFHIVIIRAVSYVAIK